MISHGNFNSAGFVENQREKGIAERQRAFLAVLDRETVSVSRLRQPVLLPGFWFAHNGLDGRWYRHKNRCLVVTWRMKG